MEKIVLKNSLTKQLDLETYAPYAISLKKDYTDISDYHDVSVSLTWDGSKYTASGLRLFGTGQSLSNPYTCPNGTKYTLGSNTTDYFLQIEIPDDCFLFSYNNFHIDTSSFSMSPNFTFAPILTTALESIKQKFLLLMAGNKESLADTIAVINAAYSDILSRESLQTPIVVSNLSSFFSDLKILAETINNTPVPSSGGSSSNVVNALDLNGSYCKYINGQVVYYGSFGLWVVERAFLMLTADNQLTPTYDLVKNEEGNIRRCTVPQDYVFPYVASAS